MVILAKEDKEKGQVENSSPGRHDMYEVRPIPYLPHTVEDRKEMLDFLGVSSVEDLLKHVPKSLRDFDLKIPPGKSEIEIIEEFKRLADKNVALTDQISFCGGGVYHRYIPAVVSEVISKGVYSLSA